MSAKNNKTRCFFHEKTAFIVIIAVAVVVILLVLFTDIFSEPKVASNDENITAATPTYLNLSETEPEETADNASETQTPQTAKIDIEFTKKTIQNSGISSGSLILVNNSYSYTVTGDFEKSLVNIYKEYGSANYGFFSGEEKLLSEAANPLNNMLTAFKNATGVSDTVIHYCYVDYATQQRYYENQVAKLGEKEASVWTKKAGCSEHHTGLAFNIETSDKNGTIGEGTYKWITDHCAEYGIIRRFPAGKQNITYEKNEPDHFRYVGVPHAAYITNEGLCLEEYITLIKSYRFDAPLCISAGDETYYVYYEPANISSDTTELNVPEEKEYTISGNNIDGFIVSWKS